MKSVHAVLLSSCALSLLAACQMATNTRMRLPADTAGQVQACAIQVEQRLSGSSRSACGYQVATASGRGQEIGDSSWSFKGGIGPDVRFGPNTVVTRFALSFKAADRPDSTWLCEKFTENNALQVGAARVERLKQGRLDCRSGEETLSLGSDAPQRVRWSQAGKTQDWRFVPQHGLDSEQRSAQMPVAIGWCAYPGSGAAAGCLDALNPETRTLWLNPAQDPETRRRLAFLALADSYLWEDQ